MIQMSLLDLMEPPVEPVEWTPRPKRQVTTRAYGRETVLEIDAENRDPVEVEISGIPTLIVWDFGPAVYALTAPGTMFWSGTGFWSLTGNPGGVDDLVKVIATRKPEPWWLLYVCNWRQHVEWTLRADDYTEPPQVAARQSAAIAQMLADGIDPNDVGPPPRFKGKWPRFSTELSA